MPLNQVWIKQNLPAGDLQLLKTCHASGVLRLTQSNYGIDQTTYFRNNVFFKLNWVPVHGKEMASANFKIITHGIDRGDFLLEISHKPSWEANQDNYTTGIHLSPISHIIQDQALIGKDLYLFNAQGFNYDYLIEIK